MKTLFCELTWNFNMDWIGFFRFEEMVNWMNSVDNTLKTILKEVNSMEEFEDEKLMFQVNMSNFVIF